MRQETVIGALNQARLDETPVVPLYESPIELWFDDRSDRIGWFRMFVEFAVLLWATVAVGLVITNRDDSPGAHGLDRSIAQWMASHRSASLTDLATIVSAAGSAWALISAAVIAGAWVWRRTSRTGIAALPLIALIDTQVIVQIAKRIVGRARPSASLASGAFGGFAWPSGHAASATAAAASACVIVAALGCSKAVRRIVSLAAGFLALLVAVSRVVLGAHWTTDVLIGGVIGITVVTLLCKPLLAVPTPEL